MDVLAILCVRNDLPYVANCLAHLARNGIHYAVIDNDSNDELGVLLREPRFRAHLVDYARLAFAETFELARQLEAKQAIAERLDAKWVIHHDADEVMHSYREDESLLEAIVAADRQGCNVVHFDEFVFLPVEQDYVPDLAGWQPMRHYYFFEPKRSKPHLMRAWKTGAGLSMVSSGGHVLRGAKLRLAPERLALRHYMFRSQTHAYVKYATRRYSGAEVAREWHHDRAGQRPEAFLLPPSAALRTLRASSDRDLDRTDPKRSHYWQWR